MTSIRCLLGVVLLGVAAGPVSLADEEAGPKVPPPDAGQAPANAAEPTEASAIQRTLSLHRDKAGAFGGQWSERKGDAVTAKEIKAADQEAFQRDFAEAAKLLESVGGLEAKAPAGQGLIGKTITIANGHRKAVIRLGAAETTLEDREGKDLRMRVVSRTAHGIQITEHTAPTLDALKKLDANAAARFESTFAGNAVVGGGGGQQIRIQLGGGAALPGQPIFGNRAFAGAPTDRTIRGYFRGAEVQIVEKPGAGISLKVTRMADGRPKVEEFAAETLKELELQSAEAAALYRRFTGAE